MNTDGFADLLSSFVFNPGLSSVAVAEIAARLPQNIPADYFRFLEIASGGEGFVGNTFLRLYQAEKLLPLNEALRTAEFVPGVWVFGSNGGGEAFGFDTNSETASIVQLPFIPLDLKYAEKYWESFVEFLRWLSEASLNPGETGPFQANPALFGKEVHEKHPIVFGGDPIDAKNKVYVPTEQYVRIVTFWNEVYWERHKR